MILIIDSEVRLFEIAQQFNSWFNFLKIEFFRNSTERCRQAFKSKPLLLDYKVKDICNLHKTVLLELHFWNKTETIETLFYKKTGLHIQIYRKNKEGWVRSNGSDRLTLEDQNQLGSISVENYSIDNLSFLENEKRL
jgi:hypothetical protein